MPDDEHSSIGDCSSDAAAGEGTFPAWLPAAGRALAATAAGVEREVAPAYERALEAGAEPSRLGEVAAMAHLFGGFPRSIQGLHHLHAVAERRELPTPLLDLRDESSTRAEHRERGLDLFLRIYTGGTPRVLETLGRTLAGFDDWVLEHAYGRVLSRSRLGGRERELLAVAALAVLDCPVQLFSHARGARELGASEDEVERMLADVKDLCSADGWSRIRTTLTRLRAD